MNHDNQDFTMIAMMKRITRMIFILLIYSIIMAIMVQTTYADGLRYYLEGDPITDLHIGDPTPIVEDEEEGTTQLWFGPSIGADIAVIDMKTREYKIGIIPGVGYGFKWKPDWWMTTPCFLSIDIFFQLSFIDLEDNGFDYLTIDILPIITAIDWISIGIGPRFNIGLGDNPDEVSWILSFGIKTST